MNDNEWTALCKFKSEYKSQCLKYLNNLGHSYTPPSAPLSKISFKNTSFANLQKEAAIANKTPDYPVETPIVYNHNWDKLTKDNTIKLILIGDNPGKDEQLHKNQSYLVGQSGKLADRFFQNNPQLQIDFKSNVIVLNKTPIHTAKTKELSYLLKYDKTSNFKLFFEETQIFTAQKTIELQQALNCPIWLVGYGELREKGLFKTYSEQIKKFYSNKKEVPVFLFQHFSMNRFIIDYNKRAKSDLTVSETLKEIGIFHRKEILGF